MVGTIEEALVKADKMAKDRRAVLEFYVSRF